MNENNNKNNQNTNPESSSKSQSLSQLDLTKIWNQVSRICKNEELEGGIGLEFMIKKSLLIEINWDQKEIKGLLQLLIASYADPVLQSLVGESREELGAMITLLADRQVMKHWFIRSLLRSYSYAKIEDQKATTKSYLRVVQSRHRHGLFYYENGIECSKDEIMIDLAPWESTREAAKNLDQVIRSMIIRMDQTLTNFGFRELKFHTIDNLI